MPRHTPGRIVATMRVLVTGHRGYIGSVLVPELQGRGHEVVGLDTLLYGETGWPAASDIPWAHKDIRDAEPQDFVGCDAVIHLAALSNDPLGELNPSLTDDINFRGTVRVAEAARDAGVRRFVYASSSSMYGIASLDAEIEEDNSTKKPLTAYARTKWEAELALQKLQTERFSVVAFRPATVFGASPALRSDIVFNNLVGCALTTGRIEIKSDGTPWRPVIHVRDVSKAFIAGIEAPEDAVRGQAFHVGLRDGNFTVRQLAEAAARVVPGASLAFTGEHGSDARTYRISFAKIYRSLGAWFAPTWSLDSGGLDLVKFLREHQFSENDFRGPRTNRIQEIRRLLAAGKLNDDLRWRM